MKFSLSELAGSLGDFGTIIPLIIAVALVSDVNTRYVLLFFGIWFILTGLYYRLPIPLEPMKAIAVIVIAGGISSGEIAASGLILGVIFLVLGYGRFFEVIDRWVPQSVVRGIQLGLALLLFKASTDFVIKDPFFFILGIAIVIVFLILFRYRRVPDLSSLCVIGVGLLGGFYLYGIPPLSFIPAPQLVIPLPEDFVSAFSTLVIPQVVLTIANAILATSLLTKDLFSADVPPKKLSTTIGLMNLTSVPFGGFPMCHGAGGLAGQYRYGARTGGANVYAGLIFLFLALFFFLFSSFFLDDLGFCRLLNDALLDRLDHLFLFMRQADDHHHGSRVGHELHPFRGSNVPDLERLVKMKRTDIHLDIFRDVLGKALYLQFSGHEIHKAAFRFDSDRLPLQLEGHRHADGLVHGDMNQVGVNELVGSGANLQLFDHRIEDFGVVHDLENRVLP